MKIVYNKDLSTNLVFQAKCPYCRTMNFICQDAELDASRIDCEGMECHKCKQISVWESTKEYYDFMTDEELENEALCIEEGIPQITFK